MAYEIIRKDRTIIKIIKYLHNNSERNVTMTKMARETGQKFTNIYLCRKVLLKRKFIKAIDTGKMVGDKRIKIYHLTKKGERVYQLIIELEDLEGTI